MAEYTRKRISSKGGRNLFGADMVAFIESIGKPRMRVRIAVEGYNPCLSEHDIKKKLMDLFSSCGEFVSLHFSKDPGLCRRRAFILLVGDDAKNKALELNETDLEGWVVHVRVVPEQDFETQRYESDLARQVYYDPNCIFGVGVGGYDTSLPPNYVKSVLTDHFASCGEITRVYLNTAASEVHIYFSEENAETRALALNGSVVRGGKLVTRRLATARNVVSPYDRSSPSPFPGGLLGVSVPEHCLEMAPEIHRKVVAFKIARGMI